MTRETVSRRLLLTPREALNERILAVLGRARWLYPVDLHGFVFLADRVEMLLTVSYRPQLTGFLAHVFRNVALAAAGAWGWDGEVFAGRNAIEKVDDAETARARLRDVHAVAVRRGLVGRPEEWPGVSSAAALLGGVETVGVWGRAAYRVPVLPLPARLGGAVEAEEMFRGIAEDGIRLRGGGRAMGRYWVRACEPTMPDPRDPAFEQVAA